MRSADPAGADAPGADPFAPLQADCSRCLALCCVGPGFSASADFAVDKPAGQPCVHLRPDTRCRIHDELRPRGFPGCVAYDCFGAGQHVVQVTFAGRGREAGMYAALPVVRGLHELRWYLEEALAHEVVAPVHAAGRAADLRGADLLGADLRGADLRGADLTDALFLTRTQVQAAVGDDGTRV